jgi:sugar lactone lactonase YvrE
MLTRRVFAAALAAVAASADEIQDQNYPIRRRKKVETLFKSPDGNPNGLEATADGLWIGEQITDRAYLVDWNGKVLTKYETHSSNTSGIAAGGGYVWMAANGAAQLRPKRPTDLEKGGRICKLDIKTGESVKDYPTPNGGGLHGLLWALDSLWITQFGPNKILQADADLHIQHSFPAPLNRAHGMGWDGQHLWCMFSNDFRILKFDVKDGKVLEAIQLDSTDPDPHGMTWWNGHLYCCDAGIAPGAANNKSKYAGYVCRLHI